MYQNQNKKINKGKPYVIKVFQRLKNSCIHQGVRNTIFKFYILIVDVFFDIQYRTDTNRCSRLDDLRIESDNRERGAIYKPTRVIPLRKVLRNMKVMIPEDSVFVDFGCGKGRVLLIASQYNFKEVRGIEFAQELCEIAEKNCVAYNRKAVAKTEIKIIKSDVVDYVIHTDENVFFLFNPFDNVVLVEILNNITISLKIKPRKIIIIYCNPRYGNIIEQHGNFAKSGEFVFWGYIFTVYSNNN